MLQSHSFFLVGGVFALLMRYELLTPEADFFSPHTYNVFFTMHGSLMVFFFIVPGVAASLGNFLIPLMIGARDVAFPKLKPWKLLGIPGRYCDTVWSTSSACRHRLDLLHTLQRTVTNRCGSYNARGICPRVFIDPDGNELYCNNT